MKTFKILLLSLVTLSAGCQQEINYKEVRGEVIEFHDKLMADDEKLMTNKMKLDTVATPAFLTKLKNRSSGLDTAGIHKQADMLRTAIVSAEDEMSKWMEDFKTDADNLSNAEAVAYFRKEKQKVQGIDSSYQALLKKSADYLKKFNVAVDKHPVGHHH